MAPVAPAAPVTAALSRDEMLSSHDSMFEAEAMGGAFVSICGGRELKRR